MKPGVYFREFEDGEYGISIYDGVEIKIVELKIKYSNYCNLVIIVHPSFLVNWTWIGEFE